MNAAPDKLLWRAALYESRQQHSLAAVDAARVRNQTGEERGPSIAPIISSYAASALP
jgi:hypothetical protein